MADLTAFRPAARARRSYRAARSPPLSTSPSLPCKRVFPEAENAGELRKVRLRLPGGPLPSHLCTEAFNQRLLLRYRQLLGSGLNLGKRAHRYSLNHVQRSYQVAKPAVSPKNSQTADAPASPLRNLGDSGGNWLRASRLSGAQPCISLSP